MWFCQPLGQVEPLLVVAALVAAFAPSFYETTRITPDELFFLSPLSKYARRTFSAITPLALLGAILALGYGWFPRSELLATASLVCVSLALLWTLVVIIFTLSELHFTQIRDLVFLPQFDKDWERDLEELKADERDSPVTEDNS